MIVDFREIFQALFIHSVNALHDGAIKYVICESICFPSSFQMKCVRVARELR